VIFYIVNISASWLLDRWVAASISSKKLNFYLPLPFAYLTVCNCWILVALTCRGSDVSGFYAVLVAVVFHTVVSCPSSSPLITSICRSCNSVCLKGQMTNCKNAPYIEIPCQESRCSYCAGFCTAIVPSSVRFTRMGENGRDGTGKERSCSEYECDIW